MRSSPGDLDACPFCRLALSGADDDLVVLRGPRVCVVPALKQRRRNRGHMLVLPNAHVTRLIDVEPSVLQDLYSVAGRVSAAVRAAFGAVGATLFQNDAAPDQTLMHIHVHVVPRTPGDEFRLPDPTSEEVDLAERRRQVVALRRALGSLP